MDEALITRYITALPGVVTTAAAGYTFFFYGSDYRLPFATLGTRDDDYDRASNLDRPSVFRLNVGVSPETYRSLFGPRPPRPGPDGVVDTGHDFTALDRLLPHPVYAPQSWICVLNPTAETFETVKPLLAQAYERAVARASRTRGQGEGEG